MAGIFHNVPRAECTEFNGKPCAAVHQGEGPDPFQPFHAAAVIDVTLYPDTWTTRDGVTHKVTEMATSHIRNVIRWMERNEEAYVAKYRSMWVAVPYPMFNGDMAQMIAEVEYDQLVTSMMSATKISDLPIYQTMTKELERREQAGLTLPRSVPVLQTASW